MNSEPQLQRSIPRCAIGAPDEREPLESAIDLLSEAHCNVWALSQVIEPVLRETGVPRTTIFQLTWIATSVATRISDALEVLASSGERKPPSPEVDSNQ